MIHNKLNTLSQSKFVRVMDILLPLIALGIAVYYALMAKDMTQASIWLATSVIGLILSIANVSKLMNRFLTKLVTRRT